ncbi:hypothetical protein QZH41_012634 [Actinostola sp. cb2023]|nr:hypothetical protein QZH41_012634 [Actinostola sp. cb2023]
MAEQIEWEPLALSLLNLLDKCEIDSEEVTYPIAANVFNGVEVGLSVILFMADTINDERQSLFLELRECFCEIHRYWWQQLTEVERRTTSAVDLGKPSCRSSGRGRPAFDIPPAILDESRGLGFTWTQIAKMLNVSRSTIHRRVKDHGLEGLSNFSDITDAELDCVIEDYISRHGPTTEDSGYLNINDPIHLFVLHYVFTPRINYALTEFKLASNLRPVRTEHNWTPELKSAINPLRESQTFGIDIYVDAIDFLERLN